MWRKLLGLAVVFALSLAATLWYLSRPGGRADPAGGSLAAPRPLPAGASYQPSAASGTEVRIGEEDLGRLVRSALEDHPNGRRALRLARELRTEIRSGRIEIGLVVNLSEIPADELDEDEHETIDKVVRYLPFLEERDLYVAVSGVPTASDGRVTVERDLRVRLAFLDLPMEEMAALFGVDPEPLRQQLVLDLAPFRAREVEVREGEVLIRLEVSG